MTSTRDFFSLVYINILYSTVLVSEIRRMSWHTLHQVTVGLSFLLQTMPYLPSPPEGGTSGTARGSTCPQGGGSPRSTDSTRGSQTITHEVQQYYLEEEKT